MKPQLCSVWLNCVNHTTLKYLPHRHCWDTSMCLSQLDGEVSAVCRKINYLHPLLLLQRAGKPFNPRFGEGGCGGSCQSLGNLCLTCPDMPNSATYLWRLLSQGTRLHLKASSAGFIWKTKQVRRRSKTMSLWERKCDVIILLFPSFGKEEAFRCLEVTELYWKKAVSRICCVCVWGGLYVHRGYKVTD